MSETLSREESPDSPVGFPWPSRVWQQLRSGAIASWPTADRSLFISVVVLGLYVYATILVSYLAANAGTLPFFNPAGVDLLLRVSYLTVASWILLVLLSLVSRRRFSESAFFVHVPIHLYALNSAFFSYMLGPVTSPFFSFAFLGGMMVSLPLFGRGPTFWGAMSMMGLVVAASVAEQWGVIPYAPLLLDYPLEAEGGGLSLVWLVGFGSFEIFGLGLTFMLAMLLIDQLQRREQDLVERGERLGHAAEELELARDAAQASDVAKSRFLSWASHETRTPLSGILGFSELLEGRHFGELNERQAGYVRQIRESGEHLLALINDLLDVTRLDTGDVELSLENVSPAEVVLEVVGNVEQGSIEKKISIVNEVGSNAPTLWVDRRRFRQSLYNLVSNAIKFTGVGGGVGLRWRVEPGDRLCIEVWDHGVGIAAEELVSIFDEFHQADRRRDEALGGSGLGLALARRLAELHGGQVRVESELGRGSSFFLVMPLASQQPDLGAGPLSDEGHSEKPAWHSLGTEGRVLVVDDNPANVAVIRGLLEVRGIDPLVARGGREAVALVSRERPQVVLMDIHMPDCDGFEALAQIRKDASLDAVRIVAMTASASQEDRTRYLKAGFDALLPKPIDSAELDGQLKRFLPARSPQ